MKLSVIIPCYNEEKYIVSLLNFLKQSQHQLHEIIIMDGMSDDLTLKLAAPFLQEIPILKICENPQRKVAFGLNKAIEMCSGDVIVRLDAHSKYSGDYFEKIIQTFENTDADIVGGPTRTAFQSPFQEAVAYVFNTPLGMGDSSVHDVNYSGYTDSVTFGAWKKKIFETTGLFDTRLKRNQDDEFHYRARSFGFKIYQNSDIKLWYFPRSSWLSLFRQYFEYGLYKPLVLKKIKSGRSLRHIIPSAFVLYMLIFLTLVWVDWRISIPMFLYISLMLFYTLKSKGSLISKICIPTVYPAIHLGYGLGFILGIFRLYRQNKNS